MGTIAHWLSRAGVVCYAGETRRADYERPWRNVSPD